MQWLSSPDKFESHLYQINSISPGVEVLWQPLPTLQCPKHNSHQVSCHIDSKHHCFLLIPVEFPATCEFCPFLTTLRIGKIGEPFATSCLPLLHNSYQKIWSLHRHRILTRSPWQHIVEHRLGRTCIHKVGQYYVKPGQIQTVAAEEEEDVEEEQKEEEG